MSYDSLFSSANSVSMKTVVAQVIAQNTLGQLDYKILWSSISLEWFKRYINFLHGHSHYGKVATELLLLVGCGQVCPSTPKCV